MSYNPRIILIKIATYYSQNYAGILGSGLSYNVLLYRDIIILIVHRVINSALHVITSVLIYYFCC